VPVKIEVADYGTHRLVDAEAATWVIGGKPAGVMTTTAKWAFADAADARQFIAGQGGEIASFDTAIAAAYAQMHTDTRMIREKRKHMQKGKMPHGQHVND
jgi:nitrous oxide reductase accessory protein NosL